MAVASPHPNQARNLNESPSEKEGKSERSSMPEPVTLPSMKVPPKRKGNLQNLLIDAVADMPPSMKVPPKRKGNDAD